MQHHTALLFGTRSLAFLGIACALGLSSCSDDNTPSWWKNLWGTDTAAAPGAQPAEKQGEAAVNTEEVLNFMIYNVGNTVRQQAGNPMWREQVRDMRNVLSSYYDARVKAGAAPAECAKLALFLADTTCNLTAYNKALDEYAGVLALLDQLPEDQRNSIDNRRIRSAVENGIGFCYLSLNTPKDALPHYEKALEIDKAIFNELAPAENAPLPAGKGLTPSLDKAAQDVLSSYRCLGECQFKADDPEEARDTYKRGTDMVARMQNLSPLMYIQYIRLLSALGNLESSCGQLRHAYVAWVTAREKAQQLAKASSSPAVQAQAIRYARELEQSARFVGKQLQEAQAAQTEGTNPQP